MDDNNLGSYPQPWLCPLCLMTNYGLRDGDRVIAMELLSTGHFLQAFAISHPSPRPQPPARLPP